MHPRPDGPKPSALLTELHPDIWWRLHFICKHRNHYSLISTGTNYRDTFVFCSANFNTHFSFGAFVMDLLFKSNNILFGDDGEARTLDLVLKRHLLFLLSYIIICDFPQRRQSPPRHRPRKHLYRIWQEPKDLNLK